MQSVLRDAAALESALEEIGFRRLGSGFGFERDGLTLAVSGGWCTLCRPAAADIDPLRNRLGRRGLWKVVDQPGSPKKSRNVLEFDLPLAALTVAPVDWDDEPDSVVGSLIDWAEATAGDQSTSRQDAARAAERVEALPDQTGESATSLRRTIESWLGADGMTIQSVPFVRQAALVCDPQRIAIRCPILQRWPETGLSEPRQQWLETVLNAAQRQWRMVRIGFGGDEGSAAVAAEVDLTGAPECALEPLVRSGRDALRWVVDWLVWPVGFLSEPGVHCDAWESSPVRV